MTNTEDETVEQTEETEKVRDGMGRFLPGNKMAHKARGVSKGYKTAESIAAKKAAAIIIRQAALEQAKETVVGSMPKLVTHLRNKALEGDNAAAAMLLRHGLPLSSAETRIENMEDVANLAPESRIRVINMRMAAGELPLEHGRMLLDAARSEIESELIQPLRALMVDLKSGLDVAQALQRLVQMTELGALSVIEPEDYELPLHDLGDESC